MNQMTDLCLVRLPHALLDDVLNDGDRRPIVHHQASAPVALSAPAFENKIQKTAVGQP